ncbi:MAG: hypothetical protein CMM47_06170 [Rhodospirillaceae bacterium]|nr:hypothetical protein [Rhodospirillaceae bacterium]
MNAKADCAGLALPLPLKWGRRATRTVLLLHVVLSWSVGLAAERQSDTAARPPDFGTAIDEDRIEGISGTSSAILRSNCGPYSTFWARANLVGYTAIWNKASALHDTFLVLIDSTGANLPPAQVVKNFLSTAGNAFPSEELTSAFDSLTWTPLTSRWDSQIIPRGGVLLFNPSMAAFRGSAAGVEEFAPGKFTVPSLTWQDTLQFFSESQCTVADSLADLSKGDASDRADSSSFNAVLSAELLSIVELWSGEYSGTGTRTYSEWVTESGVSNGLAPWDSTATTVYDADDPIRIRITLEEATVFAVYFKRPEYSRASRFTLYLGSFERGSNSESYNDSQGFYGAGTQLGSDSMFLWLNLSLNSSDGVRLTRESDGAIRGEVSYYQHRDLFPRHSKEIIDFVVYAENLQTPIEGRDTGPLPAGPYLYQNAPNPFNGSTLLRYALDREQAVKLVIYSLSGQRIAQLVDAVQIPGYYEIIWDGRDRNGRQLASGLYLARLLVDQFVETRKLLLIR